ncbi:MAG: hypothetical protein IJ572_05640 [Bacilli bacterium]|nr:hypothetical protein [Bacilli bacterium]
MESRINKYNNNDNSTLSRTKKNQNLYSEINDLRMDTFDVNSNSMIISNNGKTIDIEKLRDMLDKKYREEPKSKSLVNIDEDEHDDKIDLDETREYDINEILSKARKEKENEDYEVERLKKLRNTQVDILSDLNIESLKEVENGKAVSLEEGDKLKTLIDTINLTEETNAIKNMDPLDILSDLKGDEDETKVEGVNELTKEIMRQALSDMKDEVKPKDEITSIIKDIKSESNEEKQGDNTTTNFEDMINEVSNDDEDDKIKTNTAKLENLQEELKGIIEKDNKKSSINEDKKEDKKIENSFYTSSSIITKDDFDDFSDLKDEITGTKIIIRILIFVVIIAFICGVVFLLNRILDWGLF